MSRKGALARIIEARKSIGEPEASPSPRPAKKRQAKTPVPATQKAEAAAPPSSRPAKKGRTKAPVPQSRFHTSLYLDQRVYGEIKIALIQQQQRTGQRQDFNQLVNALLEEWLRERS